MGHLTDAVSSRCAASGDQPTGLLCRTTVSKPFDRRAFLRLGLGGCVGFTLFPGGCETDRSGSTGTGLFDANLEIDLPARLFFPDRSNLADPLQLVRILDAGGGKIELRFADGGALVWAGDSSFESSVRSAGGRITREGLAAKTLMAHVLCALYPRIRDASARALRGKIADIDPKAAHRLLCLRRDLEALQLRSTLAQVSARRVLDLVQSLGRSWESVVSIIWDRANQQFVLIM